MPYFPEDIIVDILSRLPVKSLLRFRCVSNPWRILISDPKFANLHLKRISEHNADNINNDHHTFFITSRLSGFFSMNYNASSEFHHEKKERELEFPIMNPSGYSVGGSCNGLIFLFNSYDQMTIWNPTTRDYKVVSRPGYSRVSAFVGFGFDSSIDDYKVVIGLYNDACYNDNSIKVKVFTLKTGTWRSIQDICDPSCFGRYVGILANGALHWLQRPQTIMSFDLAQEQFRELVSLPYSIKERFFLSIQLGVLQGCLCLCHTTMDKKNEVWVMKEYGVSSSWSKLFSVSYETGIKYNYYFMTLCILKNGDVLMDFDGAYMVRYSLEDKTFRGIIGHGCGRYKPVLYVESLVSPNC